MSTALMTAAAAVIAWGAGSTAATAIEPCGDFGECKVLIEINATDGDIGFHFLFDGDDLIGAEMEDPNEDVIYTNSVAGPLAEQFLTENFAESAEPLCFDPLDDDDPDNDDEDFVTLEEFVDRWTAGTYTFTGFVDGEEDSEGETELTFDLPAAPKNLAFEFNDDDGVISWKSGNDLGECASNPELNMLVPDVLPTHPKNVPVAAWEAVLEPDVEDGDPIGSLVFSIRVPEEQLSVTGERQERACRMV